MSDLHRFDGPDGGRLKLARRFRFSPALAFFVDRARSSDLPDGRAVRKRADDWCLKGCSLLEPLDPGIREVRARGLSLFARKVVVRGTFLRLGAIRCAIIKQVIGGA